VEPLPDAELQLQNTELNPSSVSSLQSPAQGESQKMDGPITKTMCIKDAVSAIEVEVNATRAEWKGLTNDDLLPIRNAVTVTCESNQRLTPKDHWQDIRQISFLVDGEFNYRPGDILTVYPKNHPEDVETLIRLQGWESVADKLIKFEEPKKRSYLRASFIPYVATMPTVDKPTLRSLLTNNLDITAIPRRYFFEVISKFTEDSMHRERLLEFTNPVYSDEFFDYTTRPRRSILEVLQDFPSVRLPWNLAPSILPLLRGRDFSICSGGALKWPEEKMTSFQICVAIVRYQTVLKKIRTGVCSRYLAALESETNLNITIRHSESFNISKEKYEKPILMIAPGTGVAPMRSLIWERAYKREYGEIKPGSALLIYGGRNARADYLFKNEWESRVLDVGVLTAFSRDQKEKHYVQDVIRQHANTIYEMLEKRKGCVFVCGSSGKMPLSVRAAIIDAFFETGRKTDWEFTRDQAESMMTALEKDGRYIQETW
jgi:sulfite reductase alpha subunit-like flavoprotein